MAEEFRRVGEKLRGIREALGWTLHDVQYHSRGEFKASALGAYERGDRSLSVDRLLRLSALYGVEAASVLRAEPEPEIDLIAVHREDLALADANSMTVVALAALARFSSYVRGKRTEALQEPIRVRSCDRELIEVLLGSEAVELEVLLGLVGIQTEGSSPLDSARMP